MKKKKITKNNNLLSVDKIIQAAKKEGIDFGKTDPYNRLRYYTKIGWLPHMIRKKTERGEIAGHYPLEVVETLKIIQDLKNSGATNEQINSKLHNTQTNQNIKQSIRMLTVKDSVTSYALLGLIIVLIILQITQLKKKDPKNVILYANDDLSSANQNYDYANVTSGVAYIPRGSKSITVKNTNINELSKIYITFNDDYSPASKYWVSSKTAGEGFTIETDVPVKADSEFNWWASN